MPREWYSRSAASNIQDPAKREFYRRIVADRKPYFMRVVYPTVMRDYNEYMKNVNKNSLREFGVGIKKLLDIPEQELTKKQREFIYYYNIMMPVGDHDCVMNKICHRFEDAFDGYIGRHRSSEPFDPSIMKGGYEYSRDQYYGILSQFKEYNRKLKEFSVFVNYEKIDSDSAYRTLLDIRADFEQACAKICPNRFVMCDIIIDICYGRSATKKFAWDICGREIIENLLRNNGNVISFPTLEKDGDIMYCGNRFAVKRKELTLQE